MYNLPVHPRYNVLQGDYSAEKPSVSFPVDAWKRWNPSSFAIQKGVNTPPYDAMHFNWYAVLSRAIIIGDAQHPPILYPSLPFLSTSSLTLNTRTYQ